MSPSLPAVKSFQSTLSVRRATKALSGLVDKAKFQSTLSVRRATQYKVSGFMGDGISIHALREESDHVPSLWVLLS